ncbi:S-layer homology domain-containing protein [Microseira sp. BLCC-F43]|uniref:S-layer homology domain-containing protein n=1 Tax=Microseira sp. BLCC-F43 TaxID=3153602 RepID=UPI0035B6FE2D
MSNPWRMPLMGVAFLALTFGVGATGFLGNSQPVVAQQARATFPDVPPDYWARPFIQSLAEKGIVTGYPDGTFRPRQAVDRDEFSAMIRQAFERARIRNIPSGSYFNDVPQGYWAETPIQEAYETGFMNDFPGNEFRPKQPLTKAEALVVLMRGLNMDYNRPVATTNQAAATPASPTPVNQRRTIARNRLAFPLAGTLLMQPLLPVIAKQPPAPAPAKTVPPTTTTTATAPSRISALEFLQSYYQDAERIPQNAVNEVAAATQANIVVNYPDPRVLNPHELLSRGSATALIHQALVNQGQIEPLPDQEAARYIPNSPRR